MKKILILSCAFFLFTQAKSQVPNPGFETRRSDGLPAYWTQAFIQVFQIDSTCHNQGMDSMRLSTHDAHSGNWAYELRVATVCGNTYSGNLKPSRYDSDSGFFDQRVPVHGQPAAFTFYYKLTSVGGDIGLAEAFMEDETGNETGSGSIQLSTAASWTKATLPVHYTTSDTGGFLRLSFRISNAAVMHYGSRFTIDDIGQLAPAGIQLMATSPGGLACFPSPAQQAVSVKAEAAVAGTNAWLTVMDITGKMISQASLQVPADKTLTADVRDLAPGFYYVRFSQNGITRTGSFMK